MIRKQTYWSTEYILAKCLPLTENSQSKASLSCHSLHISTCSINGNKANLSLSLPFCSSLMFNFLCLFWTNLFFVEYVSLSHSTSARSSGLSLFTLSLCLWLKQLQAVSLKGEHGFLFFLVSFLMHLSFCFSLDLFSLNDICVYDVIRWRPIS